MSATSSECGSSRSSIIQSFKTREMEWKKEIEKRVQEENHRCVLLRLEEEKRQREIIQKRVDQSLSKMRNNYKSTTPKKENKSPSRSPSKKSPTFVKNEQRPALSKVWDIQLGNSTNSNDNKCRLDEEKEILELKLRQRRINDERRRIEVLEDGARWVVEQEERNVWIQLQDYFTTRALELLIIHINNQLQISIKREDDERKYLEVDENRNRRELHSRHIELKRKLMEVRWVGSRQQTPTIITMSSNNRSPINTTPIKSRRRSYDISPPPPPPYTTSNFDMHIKVTTPTHNRRRSVSPFTRNDINLMPRAKEAENKAVKRLEDARAKKEEKDRNTLRQMEWLLNGAKPKDKEIIIGPPLQ
eukprot:NODE_4079_length_1234_cov_45.047705_g3585_i0.p1 GENE.NODE_4079_length_1234_cov_45.047705_g3585_i0~~NODE_4079_length_1234_cov_45.047705_g3585_i0.p1  ORF type:complete len:360 (-),score=88.61 NODE_4079_length_1234_cov_45.047705_g3585_i0:94-1173(-)